MHDPGLRLYRGDRHKCHCSSANAAAGKWPAEIRSTRACRRVPTRQPWNKVHDRAAAAANEREDAAYAMAVQNRHAISVATASNESVPRPNLSYDTKGVSRVSRLFALIWNASGGQVPMPPLPFASRTARIATSAGTPRLRRRHRFCLNRLRAGSSIERTVFVLTDEGKLAAKPVACLKRRHPAVPRFSASARTGALQVQPGLRKWNRACPPDG